MESTARDLQSDDDPGQHQHLLNDDTNAIKLKKYENQSPRDLISNNQAKPVKNNLSSKNLSTVNISTERSDCLREPCGPNNKWYWTQLTNITCVVLTYLILFYLIRSEMVPGGQLLTLCALILTAFIVGQLVKLIQLPPLIGMLVTGIVFRNAGLFMAQGPYREVVSVLREVALTTILIKAGLGLDPKALKKMSLVVLGLSFVPCIIEAAGVAISAFFLLDFPWPWGFALGFVLSAVSPAVVVPTLLKLQAEGFGEAKGISTMVIAASSLDDVVAISAFGLCLGLVLDNSHSNLFMQIVRGPAEACVGLLIGIVWGICVGYLPHKEEKFLTVRRAFLVGAGGLVAVFFSHRIGFPGAGPLVSITAAFVACLCWKLQGWSVEYNPVEDVFSGVWKVLEPTLFGLTGAEIDFSHIETSTLLEGSGVVLGGLTFRVIGCCAVIITTSLNWKEILFVNVAWLPKATVQAALGSVLLDSVRELSNYTEDQIKFGKNCLTIAVLSIILTAPVGAIGISLLGPKCLSTEGSKASQKLQKTSEERADNNVV